MTEKKCQLTEKLRNYVYRYGTELSDDKLKKMGIIDKDGNINENTIINMLKSYYGE